MIVIDKYSRSPIYEQLAEGIEADIMSGFLPAGAQIPSVRELSLSLCVNPNTVQKALLELEKAGAIVSSRGVGSFVAPDAVEKIRARAGRRLGELESLIKRLLRAGVGADEIQSAVQHAVQNSINTAEQKEAQSDTGN